ncbi:MAG: hypothetical protein ACOCWA_03680, partial [Bacteroidota bacterium]
MIFIKLLFKIRIFFFLIIICINAYQGKASSYNGLILSYIIDELTLPSSISETQVHDVKFDNNGYLYISSERFLWIYDGNKWHKVHTESPVNISIPDTSGLFVSGEKKVYALAADKNKRFILNEIYENLNGKDILEKTFFFHGHLILKFTNRLSYLNEKGENHICDLRPGTNLFLKADNIFISSNEETVRLTPSLQLINIPEINFGVTWIKNHHKGYLILREDSNYPEIFSKDFQHLDRFSFPAADIKDVKLLRNKKLLILSGNNEILICGNNGELMEVIQNSHIREDEESGILLLQNSKIMQFNNNTAWIINYPSRIRKVINKSVINIYDLEKYDNEFFIASDHGIISLSSEKILFPDTKILKLYSSGEFLFFCDEKNISVYNSATGEVNIISGKDELFTGKLKDGILYRNDSVYFLNSYSFTENKLLGFDRR